MSLEGKLDVITRFNEDELRELDCRRIPLEVALKYDLRFDWFGISRLVNAGILPQQADIYHLRFTGAGIVDLIQKGCSPENAEKYDDRFDGLEVAILHSAKVSPEYAKLFAEWYDGWGIVRLTQAKCPPKIANEYSPDLSVADVEKLYRLGCVPEAANRYPGRFGCDIPCLIRADISPIDAMKFGRIFSGEMIVELQRRGFSAEQANKYSERFGGWGIIELLGTGCDAEYANHLASIAIAQQVRHLYFAGFALEEVTETNVRRFTMQGIAELVRNGCSLEQSLEYAERFGAGDVIHLVASNIKSGEANRFGMRFSGQHICDLVYAGCSAESAETYSKRFSGTDVAALYTAGCTPDVANAFGKGFTIWDIQRIFARGFRVEDISRYSDEYNGRVIARFVEIGASPELVNSYRSRFIGDAVITLLNVNCPPEEAVEYISEFRSEEIAILYTIGLKPSRIPKAEQKRYLKLFKRILRTPEITGNQKKFQFIAGGASGVVFLRDKSAWKFSADVEREYSLLQKVKEVYNGELRNVIKSSAAKPIDGCVFALEFIDGDTLEELLAREGAPAYSNVLKYCGDILNGITELRSANIYHRDLHLGNIMVETKTNRAVIIDLDTATTDAKEVYSLNRAFGGNNDLVSLGQIVYKLSIGKNLFNEGVGVSSLSFVKNTIRYERAVTYGNTTKLQNCFSKVRKDVPGQLGELIVYLLNDDLWKQPSLEKVQEAKKMFEGYFK